MKTYTKHPDAITEVTFDFRAQLLALNDTGSVATILADAGITTALNTTVPGVYVVQVGAGTNGTQYDFGLRLLTSGGAILVDTRRMRVRGVLVDIAEDADGGTGDVFLDGGS